MRKPYVLVLLTVIALVLFVVLNYSPKPAQAQAPQQPSIRIQAIGNPGMDSNRRIPLLGTTVVGFSCTATETSATCFVATVN